MHGIGNQSINFAATFRDNGVDDAPIGGAGGLYYQAARRDLYSAIDLDKECFLACGINLEVENSVLRG